MLNSKLLLFENKVEKNEPFSGRGGFLALSSAAAFS